jgi:hypothetical protein
MPHCKNDPKRTYTGSEPSPKGRGYCAHAEKVGQKRKGGDGEMWEVKLYGKTKRWVKDAKKVEKKVEKKTEKKSERLLLNTWLKDLGVRGRGRLMKLMNETKKKLMKEDIAVEIIPNHKSPGGFYWGDYPLDVMSEKYENEVINMNYIIICLRIDENKRLELINGDVYLLHKLSAKAKKKVDEILKKDFGKNYDWNMFEYKTIKIKIE